MTSVYEGLRPCTHRTVDDSGRILCGLIKGGDREVSVNLCRACPVPHINCQHLRAAMHKRVSTPITVRFATGRVELWDDQGPTIEFKQAACVVKTMPIHSARDCTGCSLRLPHSIPQTANQVARRAKAASSPQVAETKVLAVPPGIEGSMRHSPVHSQIAERPGHSNPEGAEEIVQRARALASKDTGERRRKTVSSVAADVTGVASAEQPPKIILLQQWLAGQFNKKNPLPKRPKPAADGDGVEEIVYSPIDPTYQEEPEYERCVGWTD